MDDQARFEAGPPRPSVPDRGLRRWWRYVNHHGRWRDRQFLLAAALAGIVVAVAGDLEGLLVTAPALALHTWRYRRWLGRGPRDEDGPVEL